MKKLLLLLTAAVLLTACPKADNEEKNPVSGTSWYSPLIDESGMSMGIKLNFTSNSKVEFIYVLTQDNEVVQGVYSYVYSSQAPQVVIRPPQGAENEKIECYFEGNKMRAVIDSNPEQQMYFTKM